MAQELTPNNLDEQLQVLENEITTTGRNAVAQAKADMEQATQKMDAAVAADIAYARADVADAQAAATGTKEQRKQARALAKQAKKAAREQHHEARTAAKSAYDTVRFTEPGNMGFLRFIQVIFVLNIIVGISGLVFIGKDGYNMSLDQVIDLLMIVVDAVSFWLIWKRKAFARTWIIGSSIAAIVIGSIVHMVYGVFNPFGQLAASIFDIFLIVYFGTSKRVRLTLDQPFNQESFEVQVAEDESYWKPLTWGFWRNLVIYFAIFSVFGHWMEAGVCLLIKYGLVPGTYDPTSQIWSDWLYPFPVYGVGFVFCALLFYPLKNLLQRKIGFKGGALGISYIVSCLVCTAIEFTMGMMVNQDLQLWDYSNMFCNFMGQVCLQNALFFGFAATIMTWIVYPALEKQFSRLSRETMTAVFVGVVAGFAILAALYLVDPPQAPQAEEETNSATAALMEERGFTQEEADTYQFYQSMGENPESAIASQMFNEFTADDELTEDELAQLQEQLALAKQYAQAHPELAEAVSATAENQAA